MSHRRKRREQERLVAQEEKRRRESGMLRTKAVKGFGEFVRGNTAMFLVFVGVVALAQAFIPTVLPTVGDKLYFTLFGGAALSTGIMLWRKWR